ncbi:hypothetical protein [Pseudomonas japonica]|uniref:Uncharacterized protein n=1 Tax=Pseudomonas japonica TaxID=256466 RepID=A0A239K2P9_9PSED|nr:hypothetical protein [Pseudomonas japonica]SNT11364.1 hypothetical protein SAMN05444352_12481 [Pseudomonas japonica]
MAEFLYVAEAVDGKNAPKSGNVTATNSEAAEKQVKALFAYPVKVFLRGVTIIAPSSEVVTDPWGASVEGTNSLDVSTKEE